MNMKAAGGRTSAGGSGTCAAAAAVGRVVGGGRVDGGGGPSAGSGGNDNSNFKLMIEGIFIGKAKPYDTPPPPTSGRCAGHSTEIPSRYL